MESEQISLPSLIVILVVSVLIIRFLFFPSTQSSGNNATSPRDSSSAMRARESAVERIQQMFPQVERRNILWDLQRNGCNIAATTERILSGRLETVSRWKRVGETILPTSLRPQSGPHCANHHRRRHSQPPITFQPPPPPAPPAAASSSTPAAAAKPAPKPTQPDLITRYKLQDRLGAGSRPGEEGGERKEGGDDSGGASAAAGKAWSSNKTERQSLLQKRRDDMILAARRKMEAKMAAEKAASGASSLL